MLYFIPTPIGNLSDISFRTLELLKTCEILICEDTRVAKSLIALLNSKYKLQIQPKTYLSFHTHNEKEFFARVDIDFFNQDIIFMSDAGMPGISDPGQSLIQFAWENQIPYEVLPGANAALLAIVSSSFCKKEFIFMGFLPNTGRQRQKDLEKVLKNPYPSVIYESPKRILDLIESIAKLEPQREIFAIKEATKKFEKKFKNTAQNLVTELKNHNLNGEWVVVIKENGEEFTQGALCESDILELELPLKTKSKLLAKLSGKNAKEIYQKLHLSKF
ncbi:16S rRNA (cytidine(1402)-2'-O)-methyltransferase [Campylobacter sp. US33a]|uniref:Ribosomal RNA small subunit methyltransferase I n=1 Tax=Campylobacter sp. CCS1377 TaxID=3158229 RepID=A0AAU7E8P0_9BACT|nr:16S rRNA (cytidine(1402)-2'-O)-methyltransferase [Campylobacter sp. US33a]MCW1359807.1 16S rRNA (cytidine(1402)-2'-O)-methyltransferase [Campylobacter jejuni]TEY03072.1 16S rRNA (cytidine(1402)-2'-O)-methyltransferase [Campylobacter sp. US33a]